MQATTGRAVVVALAVAMIGVAAGHGGEPGDLVDRERLIDISLIVPPGGTTGRPEISP